MGLKKKAAEAKDRITKRVRNEFNPGMKYADGYGHHVKGSIYEKVEEYHKQYCTLWEFSAQQRYLMFSYYARGMSEWEITEQFMSIFFDWPEIRRIGNTKSEHCKNQKMILIGLARSISSNPVENEDGSVSYEKAVFEGENYTANELFMKSEELGVIEPHDYGDYMTQGLRTKIHKYLKSRYSKKWKTWIEKERMMWRLDSNRSLPLKNKENRIALLQRCIELEMVRGRYRDIGVIIRVLEQIRKETEGDIQTVKVKVDEVVEQISQGGVIEGEWKDVKETAIRLYRQRLAEGDTDD